MNLLKSKLSVAIAAGLLSGSALAAPVTCSITPANSIITDGQILQLTAACDAKLASISWKMGATLVAEDTALSQDGAAVYHYTTPIGLASSSVGQEFKFSALGTGADTVTFSNTARVAVKPSSAVVALAANPGLGASATTPADAKCGDANGTTVPALPTTNQCGSGKMALAVSSPAGFTWSCLSLTGGAEASCYAMRTGYVPPVDSTPTVYGACGSSSGQTLSVKPTGGLCNSGTASSFATGSAYTWTCSGSNAAVTSDDASCSATIATASALPPAGGSVDPGIGSGLWVPADNPNLFVVDQSGTGISTSYVPGCLNGTDPGSSSWSGCAANNSFTASGVKVEIMKGKVLSVRYKSNSTAGNSKKWFTVTGFDGGNTGPVYVWLTDDPLKTYDETDSKCKAYSTSAPSVITGYYKTSTYCQISPNKTYYLNVKSDLTTASKFKIFEDGSDMLP